MTSVDNELTNDSIEASIGEEDYDDESKLEITKFKIVSNQDTYSEYYTSNKITKAILTKFEKAKLLGIRSEMISNGSPLFIKDIPKNIHLSNNPSYDLALLEFKERKIPLLIRRYLPNGSHEDWRLEDMIVNN